MRVRKVSSVVDRRVPARMGLVLGLVLVLTLLFVGPALAFPDVDANHPYADAIQQMADQGIVNGYRNGDFGPDDFVLRQQFAKMISLTLDLPAAEYECYFTDVDRNLSPTDPLFPDHYIAVCAAWGITTGVTATTFDPYTEMSRAQLITMVARAAELPEVAPDYSPPFGNFDATHYPWAARAYRAGLLNGLEGMGPGYDFWRLATRGEVCRVLSNLLAWQASDQHAVWQAIEQSGIAVDDFEIVDSLVIGRWAGVIIGSPGLDNLPILLYRSGLVGWAIMDYGTGLAQADWLAYEVGGDSCPLEIAQFLSPEGG